MSDSPESKPSDPAATFDASVIGRYEPYIAMLARVHSRKAYRAKIGHSDVVQAVMMQAVAGVEGFRGQSEAEFRGWLRQILAHHLCHLDRDLHREKRDIRREQSMEQKLAQSSMRLEQLLAGEGPTPSTAAMAGENILRVTEAIERLPESQRAAIRLHYLEGMKLSEVAEAIGKSAGAVAGLLHRGMKTLREQMQR